MKAPALIMSWSRQCLLEQIGALLDLSQGSVCSIMGETKFNRYENGGGGLKDCVYQVMSDQGIQPPF